MTYFTGHIPDPPDVVARRKGFHLLKAKRGLGAAPLPLKTNNGAFLAASAGGPGILNQVDTSSCEGHAHGSGITTRFAILGKPIPLVSPKCVYDVARIVSRSPNPDGSIPPLVDEGTEPNLVLAGLGEWGAASAVSWGNYPVSSSTINLEPTPQALMLAGDFKLLGAYFLDGSAGDAYLIALMTALAAGYPVTGAIAASSSTFQGYSGGVLPALDADVDHATLWLDYEWDGSNLSSLVVDGVNSWGEVWGAPYAPGVAGGMYQAGRDFLAKYASATAVLDLASTGAEQ